MKNKKTKTEDFGASDCSFSAIIEEAERTTTFKAVGPFFDDTDKNRVVDPVTRPSFPEIIDRYGLNSGDCS